MLDLNVQQTAPWGGCFQMLQVLPHSLPVLLLLIVLNKTLNFALNKVLSFSTYPLRTPRTKLSIKKDPKMMSGKK